MDEFNSARGNLLGAILDRLSGGLRMLAEVDRSSLPRMADAAAFGALPDEVRGRVLVRLRAILEGRDDSDDFKHLSTEHRKQILEILNDAKPEFKKR